MDREEIQNQALRNATQGDSLANYPAIFDGFMARGIPEDEIRPRENVFTYNAWQKLGRQVRRNSDVGKGVKVITFVEFGPAKPDAKTGETNSRKSGGRRARRATVFHIRQTCPIDGEPDLPPPPILDPNAEPVSPQADDGAAYRARLTATVPGAGLAANDARCRNYVEPKPAANSLTFDGALPLGSPSGMDPQPRTAPADVACQHTQRKIAPGMPCVQCGALADSTPSDYCEA